MLASEQGIFAELPCSISSAPAEQPQMCRAPGRLLSCPGSWAANLPVGSWQVTALKPGASSLTLLQVVTGAWERLSTRAAGGRAQSIPAMPTTEHCPLAASRHFLIPPGNDTRGTLLHQTPCLGGAFGPGCSGGAPFPPHCRLSPWPLNAKGHGALVGSTPMLHSGLVAAVTYK